MIDFEKAVRDVLEGSEEAPDEQMLRALENVFTERRFSRSTPALGKRILVWISALILAALACSALLVALSEVL